MARVGMAKGLGMAVVMLMMGSSSPVITKLALLVGKVDLGSREDLDVSANMLSQFCCQTKKMFHLIFFQPPCVVVVNMDGKSSEAADAVKREVKLVEKVCNDLGEDSGEDRSQL